MRGIFFAMTDETTALTEKAPDKTAEKPLLTPEELYPTEEFREMVDAGVFFGRKKSKTHPKMKPAILTNRNGIEIINLAKTTEGIERAEAFVQEKAKSGALILVVATQPSAASMQAFASKFGFPIVTRRWIGGTLTNFRIIKGRIDYFKKLRSDWERKAFERYTKKERVMIERELGRLTELMGGIEALDEKPGLMIVIDPQVHVTAIREAKHVGVPVVAFANTDSDPAFAEYPVVGNSRSRLSVEWFAGRMEKAIEAGRALRQIVAESVSPKAEEETKKEKPKG